LGLEAIPQQVQEAHRPSELTVQPRVGRLRLAQWARDLAVILISPVGLVVLQVVVLRAYSEMAGILPARPLPLVAMGALVVGVVAQTIPAGQALVVALLLLLLLDLAPQYTQLTL
jgi:hypothetical protein